MNEKIRNIDMSRVKLRDAFWTPRQRLITHVSIPYMERVLADEIPGVELSSALRNFKIAAGLEKGEFHGMVFQDSDVYKWLETVAYSLIIAPDEALESRADEIISIVARAQQPDGYLNTFFTLVEPENKWRNLLKCHELYCAGHLLEAACAYYEATQKRALLDVGIRLADHIISRFGPEGEEGVPGHQEIELGLVRLYHTTGDVRFLDMAKRFLDLRGADKNYFKKNTPPKDGIFYGGYEISPDDLYYNQSYLPVREQRVAHGHAVRQLYMLAAMAEVARDTGDDSLLSACEEMWANITNRQMYVTGALGQSSVHEAFTIDWDLPNDTAYGETCASVAMAFWASAMLGNTPRGEYADILELELYNGALAGMSADGKGFFYVNPLQADPALSGVVPQQNHVLVERPPWHACACCPTNLSRLIASLGRYVFSESESHIYAHLFIGCEAELSHAHIDVESGYPWKGQARYEVTPRSDVPFALSIRVPGYAGTYKVLLNGEIIGGKFANGYLEIYRKWEKGDVVELSFELGVRRVYANPRVWADAGKVALMRGPIVYCFEGVDNPWPLSALRLPEGAQVDTIPARDDGSVINNPTVGADIIRPLPADIVRLRTQGMLSELSDDLYQSRRPEETPVELVAIPYYAWANRGPSQMCVWIRE